VNCYFLLIPIPLASLLPDDIKLTPLNAF